MTFEEIAQDIQCRRADQGEPITNFQSKRLAAQAIVEGFRTVGEAQKYIDGLRETGNCLFTAMGYEVDWETLSWAVYMFLPIQAPEEMREVILAWYEED